MIHINTQNQTRQERRFFKRIKGKCSKQKTVKSMADVNPNISIITLNMNCLNIPIKRQGLTKWIKKNQDLSICCLSIGN